MSFRAKLAENWRAKILAAGGIALLGMLVFALPVTQELSYLSYDLPFGLRPEISPKEALIVFMDDESRIKLGQPVQGPWDRALHAQLIKELAAHGAKAVIIDVLFDEPWPQKEVDEELAAAIKAFGRVVLGASCGYSGDEGGAVVGRLKRAAEPLASVAPWGVAELPLDLDQAIRRQYVDDHYTNLAWQAAVMVGQAPKDRESQRWINYYGPEGTIPHVSYVEVLSNALPVQTISNKLVFLGKAPIIDYEGSKSRDDFATSFTRWTGGTTPGVEIQATACLNLMRREWISRLPLSLELGIIIISALALAFLLPMFSLIPGIVLGMAVILLMPTCGVIMMTHFHQWFSWAVVAFVEAPFALVFYALTALSKRSSQIPLGKSRIEPYPAENGPLSIPDHQLLRPFGIGSYGEVWLAKSVLGTYRAVKIVFRAAFHHDGPFEREFNGIKAFEPISRSHDGFVDILQVGRRDKEGYYFYVMELADDQESGEQVNPERYRPRTLSNELAHRGRIPAKECLEIAISLTGALQRLHESGLLHRDIKPSNIIFVRGIAKLADVGLVTASTEAKSFVGTEGFIPPEGPGSAQADIYSLGKVCYEMAMGRDRCLFPELPTDLPEDAESRQLLELNEIILKACAGNTRRRYASAEKMLTDLKRLSTRLKASKNRGR